MATFFRVILPLSAAGAVTGIVLSFAHTIGEFGVVLMVGGNIPGVTRTVSIDIYDQVQAANYDAANRTALDTFLRYHHEQGLSARRWTVEEIIAPELIDT